jgi:hypothetical protein
VGVRPLLALGLLLFTAPAFAQAPTAPAQTVPPAAAPTPATPAATAARTFTAPVGVLFNTVRPERVGDFERVIGYLQAAFEKSADEKIRAQAEGWRIYRAAEPGPGGSVLYVYILDPTVVGADYGLGRILADAYDTTQLQEIWKLYTGAITGGGTLLNLTPVKPDAAAPSSQSAPPATQPTERPLPPDADPNRR